ncbi:hypothetical protein NDU88_007831 [Pleurodeles waltl]|uniref:Uncharacterized protein n=1 Tax=Pleurodeles waltl TaxID=8319 RepID=A0AAV7VQU4_PLEWA|nr:hypothetical protein NDU88_007831 [Pleurodeles waltl]
MAAPGLGECLGAGRRDTSPCVGGPGPSRVLPSWERRGRWAQRERRWDGSDDHARPRGALRSGPMGPWDTDLGEEGLGESEVPVGSVAH